MLIPILSQNPSVDLKNGQCYQMEQGFVGEVLCETASRCDNNYSFQLAGSRVWLEKVDL